MRSSIRSEGDWRADWYERALRKIAASPSDTPHTEIVRIALRALSGRDYDD